MTIERTREIFSTTMKDWTDDQVLQFISTWSSVADDLLKNAIVSLTQENKKSHTRNKQE